MGGIVFLENINMMVLSSIVIVVFLAFMLVVVVFTVKFKSQQENNRSLRKKLDEKLEKLVLLEDSLSKIQTINTSQMQKLKQQKEIKIKLEKEIDLLYKKLKNITEKTETLNIKIASLEKEKSELGATLHHTKEELKKLEEALEHANKRNEFWVEQMTEVRTKYEALKLKVK